MRSELSIEWVIGVYLRFTICSVITVSVDTHTNNELLIESVCGTRARISTMDLLIIILL